MSDTQPFASTHGSGSPAGPPREAAPASRNRGRVDVRLLPAAALAWGFAAAAGLGALSPGLVLWVMFGALALALGGCLLALRARRARALLAALVFPAATLALLGASLAWQTPSAPPGGNASVQFTVAGDPGRSSSGAAVVVPARVSTDAVTWEATVIAGDEALRWLPGQRYAAQARIDDAVFVSDVSFLGGEPSPAQAWRQGVRDGLVAAAGEGPGAGRTLLPGLVLGDTRFQDPALAEDMRAVSMTHLTAVSGSNLAIVSAAVWWVAAACGGGVRVRSGAAFLAVVGYAWIVGPEPSVLRAGVMACAVLVGLVRGSTSRGLPVLWAAIVVLLVAEPSLATAPGFLLSVVACAGILLLAGPLADGVLRRWPRPLAHLVTVPLAAQIACAPIVLFLAPQVSPWAVPANIVASPAVAPATILGLAATLTGLVHPFMAVFLAWPGVLAASWIAGTAQLAAAAPLAILAWPAAPWGAVLLAAIGAAVAIGTLALRHRPLVGLLTLACALAGAIVASGLAEGRPWPPRGWVVAACDVGQGSASVVALPEAGRALVVDTGPEPAALDACLDDLKVSTVDLVLSHFDADHAGGVEGLGRRTILSATVSPVDLPAPGAREVSETLADMGVPVVEGFAGAGGAVGDVRWSFLWPDPVRSEPDSANDGSLVVRVDAPGLSVLLPGDLGEAPQAVLARSAQPVDVFFAPHHGSSDMDERLYRAAGAPLTVYSVGADNRYGHPTRRALAAAGPGVALRTDLCGGIAVMPGPAVATQEEC